MKRRVIKQGNNTLTITLPRKWAEKHGIKAGEEIEVEEKSETLLISSSNGKQIATKEIDLSDFGPLIPRVIYALYKKGYDKIHLQFSDKSALPLIQSAMGNET